jgi:hypothetical protein
VDAYKRGDYKEAAEHAILSIPIIGAPFNEAANEMREPDEGHPTDETHQNVPGQGAAHMLEQAIPYAIPAAAETKVGQALGAGVKAAAPGLATAVPKAAAGIAISNAVPGLGMMGRLAFVWPAMRSVRSALSSGSEAFSDAMGWGEKAAAEEVAPAAAATSPAPAVPPVDPLADIKDQIARGNFKKPYARMNQEERSIVDNLAERIGTPQAESAPQAAHVRTSPADQSPTPAPIKTNPNAQYPTPAPIKTNPNAQYPTPAASTPASRIPPNPPPPAPILAPYSDLIPDRTATLQTVGASPAVDPATALRDMLFPNSGAGPGEIATINSPAKPGMTKEAYVGQARMTRADSAGILSDALAGMAGKDLSNLKNIDISQIAQQHGIPWPKTKPAQVKLIDATISNLKDMMK